MTWLRLPLFCIAALTPAAALSDSSADVNKLLRRAPGTEAPSTKIGSDASSPKATEGGVVTNAPQPPSPIESNTVEAQKDQVLSKSRLDELVTAATTLVIAIKGDAVTGTGSGLSLGDRLLLTNTPERNIKPVI